MWKIPYRAAVLTASDRCAAGLAPDESGPLVCRRLREAGGQIIACAVLPDDRPALEGQLRTWCDQNAADLIVTTGGTGLAPRDVTPEATRAVAQRLVPGIAEAMRAHGMRATPMAMLGRGTAAVRGQTLIVNLPGSPRAAGESLDAVLPVLEHALAVLRQGKEDDPHGALAPPQGNEDGDAKR